MNTAARPAALPVNPDSIPHILKERVQWVGWRWSLRDGKRTKAPVQANNPNVPAKSTDPATWGRYSAAFAAHHVGRCDGIGFALSPDDDLVVLDIDHCVDAAGMIDAEALGVIRELASYAEISPSGTGVHVWIKGKKPAGARSRTGRYELYEFGRYMTVTGRRLEGFPATIEPRQTELDSLYWRLFPGTSADTAPGLHKQSRMGEALTDDHVLKLAREARNGAKFARLWAGDTSEHDSDDSRADAALAAMLCFWTPDDHQVARLMLQSGLRRDKFDRSDYLERTIAAARAGQTEHYISRGESVRFVGGRARKPDDDRRVVAVARRPWPVLHVDALHGLAGDIVRAIDPHTEADPAATLVTFLIMFGSAAGRSPCVWIGEDRHGANEFACLVGDTANGRKGSSYNGPRRIVAEADPAWRIVSGLASGEGFVWQIRDPIYKVNKKTGETEMADEGEKDKRLFVFEGEFSKVLNQTERNDNTLSPNLRLAWDGQTLQKLTLTPVTATDPHVSILAHITPGELRKRLNATETANGFANRFLFVCVRRSKYVPRPGRLPDDVIRPFVVRVVAALDHARKNAEFSFTEAAGELWDSTYPALVDVRAGLFGELTARRAPHTWRLAMIYAALDCSPVIDVAHLKAALAFVAYADASVLYLFGDATGDHVADRILSELETGAELTRLDISKKLFSGNRDAAAIDAAIDILKMSGRIGERKSTGGNGRPATVFYAICPNEENEVNEESSSGRGDTSFTSYAQKRAESENGSEIVTEPRCVYGRKLGVIADPARWPLLNADEIADAIIEAHELVSDPEMDIDIARQRTESATDETERQRQRDRLTLELWEELLNGRRAA